MFILDKKDNSMSKIDACSFKELGFNERDNLQEWIAKNPDSLCTNENDRLLIIQKEFDGFNDTNERLDLLALDQDGSLVIIENKLDDSGRDVNWQTLKYVSYCSTLKRDEIKDIYQAYLNKQDIKLDAKEDICNFFDGMSFDEIPLNVLDQRMILVAANFRKEVTSTVMWMLNHQLRIECFKATPYKLNNDILIDLEQIIPIQEAEEYMIRLADKNRESDEIKASGRIRGEFNLNFWGKLLECYRKVDSSFNNVNPSDDHWLNCGSGVSRCPFTFTFTRKYASIELSIFNASQSINKEIYDGLYKQKGDIDSKFGQKLSWERLSHRKMSRIALRKESVNIYNQLDWDEVIKFMCENMPKLISILKEPLKIADAKHKNK